MIKSTTDINTKTHEGRLAMALLALVTTTANVSKTPDDVIKTVQPLITKMFEGEPEVAAEGLVGVPTNKLVTELKTREGVESIEAGYLEPYHVEINNFTDHDGTGPAILLVVTD